MSVAVVGGTTKAALEAYYEERRFWPRACQAGTDSGDGQPPLSLSLSLSLPTRESGSKSSSSSEGASCAVSATPYSSPDFNPIEESL